VARLRPRGRADLTAYVSRPARSDYVRVARSRRPGRATDTVRLVNGARRRVEVFVGVDAAGLHRGNVPYQLAIRRP
jgi:hypothetical protein